MKYRRAIYLFLVLLTLNFTDCAKRGTIYGGWKDTLAPTVLRFQPDNYSTEFKGNEIRISFDEYIRLNDLQKNLVISPPTETMPQIRPMGVSKQLRIIFSDTLKENTTYTLNFGNSIVDNNEGNPLSFFKYVFSTGNYTDSLSVSGTIRDALALEPDEKITVALYEANAFYNDSVVYTQKPFYLSNTSADPNSFTIENIKPGRYKLLALKDKNSDYIFDPKNDKIGFVEGFIEVPSDTIYNLSIFKEIPDYKFSRGAAIHSGLVQLGFEGKAEDISIELLGNKPGNFEQTFFFDRKKDTVYYWFKPAIERDSLQLLIAANKIFDTVTIRAKNDVPVDSLRLSPLKTGSVVFAEDFEFTANNPMVRFDREKVRIMNKDSALIDFTSNLDTKYNVVSMQFVKEERQAYLLTLYPGAVTDFYGFSNDTLSYNVNTRSRSDYGYLSMQVVHQKNSSLIVELVNEKGTAVQTILSGNNNKTLYEFNDITPGKYYVRVIVDQNNNGLWDTGRFLTSTQPEEVIYFPKLIEIRANWTLNETFVLK